MPKDVNNNIDFTKRVQNLFASIFGYHFERKPSIPERKTPFGNYTSMRFRRAAGSPLALLFNGGNIREPMDRQNRNIDEMRPAAPQSSPSPVRACGRRGSAPSIPHPIPLGLVAADNSVPPACQRQRFPH